MHNLVSGRSYSHHYYYNYNSPDTPAGNNIDDDQSDVSEFPTYSVVRKKPKISIPDVPPPLPAQELIDYCDDESQRGGASKNTVDPLYQELPESNNVGIKRASLYEVPFSVTDRCSVKNQHPQDLSSRIENVLYCEI